MRLPRDKMSSAESPFPLCLFLTLMAVVNGLEQLMDLPLAPILLQTVNTVVLPNGPTQTTLTYATDGPVNVFWTVDGDFPIQHVYPTVGINNINSGGVGASTLTIPQGTNLTTLTAHVISSNPLYEIHLQIAGRALQETAELPVLPYHFYSPPESEIGLSAKGKSQFHVFLNTTQSKFVFGAVIADLWLGSEKMADVRIQKHSAYTFRPDNISDAIRLRPLVTTDHVYHADVMVNSPILAKRGGILFLISMCNGIAPEFLRMDIRRTVHIHPDRDTPPLPQNTVSFVDTGTDDIIRIHPGQDALIRCTAFGNPLPVISLMRNGNRGKRVPMPNVPSLMTPYPYMTSAVFTLKDARKHGRDFACKAESGKAVAYRAHKLQLVKN